MYGFAFDAGLYQLRKLATDKSAQMEDYATSVDRVSVRMTGYTAAVIGCMLAQDNEASIGPALRSLIRCTDMQIVVDGGSTDRTRDIARGYGATVLEHEWPSDNGKQRQVYVDYVLGIARGSAPWLVVLDTDEILAERDIRLEIARASNAGLDHLWMRRKWLVSGKTSLGFVASRPHYPDWQLRVYKPNPSVVHDGLVHECVHGLRRGERTAALEILHLNLMMSPLEERLEKIQRYERVRRGSGAAKFYAVECYGYVVREARLSETDRTAVDEVVVRAAPLTKRTVPYMKYLVAVPHRQAQRGWHKLRRDVIRVRKARAEGHSWREVLR